MAKSGDTKHVSFATQLIAGGTAGAMEAVSIRSSQHSQPLLLTREIQLCCQPLDTIKVRMQLSRSGSTPGVCRLKMQLAVTCSFLRHTDQASRVLCDRRDDRASRDSFGVIQRSRRCALWHRPEDGDPVCQLRGVQESARPSNWYEWRREHIPR